MKNKASLILILFIHILAFAQPEIINDPEINRLNNLLKIHARTSDSLTFYANELLKYAEKNHLEFWRYRAYVALGNSQRNSGNIFESNQNYHTALHIAKQLSDDQSLYRVMNNIALNHKRLNRNDSAYYYFKKLEIYYTKELEMLPANMAKMDIGLTFLQYQELDSATFYLNASYKGFKELDNVRYIAQNLNLLGELEFQKEEFNRAIKNTEASLKLAIDNKLDFLLPSNYILLSRIYSQTGDKEKAVIYSDLAREFKPKTMDFSQSRIAILNEDIKIEKAKAYESRLNEVEDAKHFFRSNLVLALLIIFLLTLVVYMLFKKHKNKENEVKDIQQKLEKIKESKKADKMDDVKVIHLKSKASFNSSNILYVKSDGHYVEYYLDTKSNPEVDRCTMIEVEKMLPAQSFIRIHKSYIVNINRIKIINSNKVMLDTGEWINLSRVYKDRLKNILHKD
jgi:tetratricopeptide (TPR) repeat protein